MKAARRASVALVLALLGASACSTVTDHEALDEIAQAVKTYGNWSAYGDGQCVTGARTFYQNRYGVTLAATGAQGSSIGACKYLGACMYWVSPKVRPSAAKWNRYEWGSVMPQTYDLVIYPPTPTNGYGHVASIDHLEGSDKNAYKNLYMMDSNFLSHEKKSAYIHTFNLKPYGFYRLKSLDGCKAHCDGTSVVDKNCKATKCSDAKAKCVSDASGPHCVHAGCPASGSSVLCEGKQVLACKNGAATTKEDCSKDTSTCVKDKLGPHCVFPGCASSGTDEVCGDNMVVTCKNGDVTAKSDCDKASSKCVDDSAGPHCVFPGCPSVGKGTLCENKTTVASCVDGTITSREDCAKTGSTCVKDASGPHCVYPGCPSTGPGTFCDDDGVIVTCLDGKVTSRDDCPKQGRVCSETDPLHCDAPPQGDFDAPGCETLGGWALDPSAATTAIDVDFVFGDEALDEDTTTITRKADALRPSPCGTNGGTSCQHGFEQPTPRSLLDGQPHVVTATGIDATGGPRTTLTHGRQVLTCPLAKPSGILRSLGNPETWANWSFSAFQDVAPMAPDAAKFSPTTYDEGPDLPTEPSFVRADDGSTDVWSIDSGVRRRVKDATTLMAWRGVVASMPAKTLAALPIGADVPTRPRLFEAEDGAIWLEDVPFLPDGVTGVNTGTEEGDDPPALSEGGAAGATTGATSDRAIAIPASSESGCAVTTTATSTTTTTGPSPLSMCAGLLLAAAHVWRRRERRTTRPLER